MKMVYIVSKTCQIAFNELDHPVFKMVITHTIDIEYILWLNHIKSMKYTCSYFCIIFV